MTKIIGQFFSPCCMTEEKFEKGYKQSIFYTDKNFLKEFEKHKVAMSHTTECAKIYILKNWKSVKSWTELDIAINDNSGKPTEYYNYIPSDRTWGKSQTVQEILIRREERRAKNHNPIVSFTDVVLDPIDGDFSLKINGKDHWWIDDESVIIIADYIEEQLTNEKK